MSAQNAERERIIKEIKHEIRMSTTTSGEFLGGEFLERMMAWHLAEVKRIELISRMDELMRIKNYEKELDVNARYMTLKRQLETEIVQTGANNGRT